MHGELDWARRRRDSAAEVPQQDQARLLRSTDELHGGRHTPVEGVISMETGETTVVVDAERAEELEIVGLLLTTLPDRTLALLKGSAALTTPVREGRAPQCTRVGTAPTTISDDTGTARWCKLPVLAPRNERYARRVAVG